MRLSSWDSLWLAPSIFIAIVVGVGALAGLAWLIDAALGDKQKSYTDAELRLDTKPADFYLEQFDSSKLQVVPARSAGKLVLVDGEWVPDDVTAYCPADSEYAFVTVQGPAEFGIRFPTSSARVEDRHIELAKALLKAIPELDADARERGASPEEGYVPVLHYIDLCDECGDTRLGYHDANMNGEWVVNYRYDSESDRWDFTELG